MRTMIAVLVASLGFAGSVRAQALYVGAEWMVSTQDGHRQGSSPSLPTTGAGGTAIGAVVEAGGLAAPWLAIGVEISLPRRFTSLQETDYSRVFQQESRHRDLAISGVVRAIAGTTHRVRLGVVGGAGLVNESTRQRRRDQAGLLPTYPPVFGPYSDEFAFSRWTVAALAGADVEIAVTPRVAIVPQMRVHVVRRSSDGSDPQWALGLDSVVLRPAIGVRALF